MVSSALEVCDAIESAGQGQALDIDNLMVREAMDVIGKVGFSHDFQAVKVGALLMVGVVHVLGINSITVAPEATHRLYACGVPPRAPP